MSRGADRPVPVHEVPADGLTHDAPRLAVFVKRDLQALVCANYLLPLACARGCTVLLLVCDFVMARERSCQALRSHMALERDVFFDSVEALYEVRTRAGPVPDRHARGMLEQISTNSVAIARRRLTDCAPPSC